MLSIRMAWSQYTPYIPLRVEPGKVADGLLTGYLGVRNVVTTIEKSVVVATYPEEP